MHEAAEGDYASVRGEVAITVLDKTGGPIVTGATISPTPPGASAVGRSPNTKDGLTALPANAVHGPGASLVFTVTFSRAVTVVPDTNTGAAPELEFATYGHGRTQRARYRGGSGSSQLTFGWTVGRGDYDPNGPGGVRFAMNGSKIEDGTGRIANTGIPSADFEAHRLRGGFYNMRLSTDGNTVAEGDRVRVTITRSGGHQEAAFARVEVTDATPGEDDGVTTARLQFGLNYGTGERIDQAMAIDHIAVPIDTLSTSQRTITFEITESDFDRGWYEIAAPASVTVAVTDNGLTTTLPRLVVEPTNTHEAAGATLDFEVRLTPASDSIVTVDYATRDGTATVADADYVATSGTLTFAAGETSHIVPVEVLPDAHDEGVETMWLVLSNGQGAQIGDRKGRKGENYGQIHNEGPIPKAWNARFGRTVATQVIDAIEDRMHAPAKAGTEFNVAQTDNHEEGERKGEWIDGEWIDESWLSRWKHEDQDWGTDNTIGGRDLVTGSSFNVTTRANGEDLVSVWGKGATTSFDGREGELSIEGEVVTGMLGADWTREHWTAGVVFAHSVGEGSYGPHEDGENGQPSGMRGTAESNLSSLFPWARHVLENGMEVWGSAGYGTGEVRIAKKMPGSENDGPEMRADLELWSAAGGVRGTLVDGGDDGITIKGKSDAMVVQTNSERGRGTDGGNLEAARATVLRLRLGVEGERTFTIAENTLLTPSLEVGIRRDAGDAETGYGVELGGGLKIEDRVFGLEAEISGRTLLTHEAEQFAERGISGGLAWRQNPSSDRRAKLALTQTFRASTTDGVNNLLTSSTLDALGANDDGEGAELDSRRLDLKLGYGLPAFGGRFTWTPQVGMSLSNSDREVTLGWQLMRSGSRTPNGGSFELTLEARRRETANDDTAPEHEIALKLRMRF